MSSNETKSPRAEKPPANTVELRESRKEVKEAPKEVKEKVEEPVPEEERKENCPCLLIFKNLIVGLMKETLLSSTKISNKLVKGKSSTKLHTHFM